MTERRTDWLAERQPEYADIVRTVPGIRNVDDIYQCVASQPLELQRGQLGLLLADATGPMHTRETTAPYAGVADIWAAMVERAYTPNSEHERFLYEVTMKREHVARVLAPYLSSIVPLVAEGRAPFGVTRLIADQLHPTYQEAALNVITPEMVDALDTAAFRAFGQRLSLNGWSGPVRLATREAYLFRRLRQTANPQDGLTMARVARLAAAIPQDDFHRSRLWQEVRMELNIANDLHNLYAPQRPVRRR